jgi:hypothetical protein
MDMFQSQMMDLPLHQLRTSTLTSLKQMCFKVRPNLEEVEELALHHADGGLSMPMKVVSKLLL